MTRRWIIVMLALFCLVNFGLMFWGVSRGFDLKDESFMLNCYRHPELCTPLTTQFHIVVTRLFGAFDFGLLQYRWAGLILRWIAALVFAWGFWQWLRAVEHPSVVEPDQTPE